MNKQISKTHRIIRWLMVFTVLLNACVIGYFMVAHGRPERASFWFYALIFFVMNVAPFVVALVLEKLFSNATLQAIVMWLGLLAATCSVFILLAAAFGPHAVVPKHAGLVFVAIPSAVTLILAVATGLMLLCRWIRYLIDKDKADHGEQTH